MNDESEYLLISGLKHFAFCRRRWALVHIEQQWQENAYTIDGQYMHEHVHDKSFSEKRGRIILSRGMSVISHTLRITGVCDMVELEQCQNGVSISGRPGTYRIYPVEYKLGKPEKSGADYWQLCAQAMCLEEMLCTDIKEGAVFYGGIRQRVAVVLDDTLRQAVKSAIEEMHQFMERRYTPKVKSRKVCINCSMREICQPELIYLASAADYVRAKISEED